MITIKVMLSDFSFGLDTYHLQYHAVHQTFTGKQSMAQLLGAVISAPSALGEQEQVCLTLDSTTSFCSEKLLL